ncbi:hypothetical protein [Streptomyces sp. NPDC002265]|uniref:hypothetical protein n=1 Tax=Streptomyces sp. NPDC002265 TaxID=3154415 RepID=UPI00332C75A6
MLPALGLVTLVLVVLSTESGEWLEEHVQETALVEEHAEMGSGLTAWVIALFVLTVAVWLLGRAGSRWQRERSGAGESSGNGGTSAVVRRAASVPVRAAVLVLALAVAVGAAVEVYRIGDSGAKAVWHGRFSTSGTGARGVTRQSCHRPPGDTWGSLTGRAFSPCVQPVSRLGQESAQLVECLLEGG